MSKKQKRTGENFKSLAAKYELDVDTFMKNIKFIREKLDACVGRNNYRRLTPKQVEIIRAHLGIWEEE
jgi:hypothetical protein